MGGEVTNLFNNKIILNLLTFLENKYKKTKKNPVF